MVAGPPLMRFPVPLPWLDEPLRRVLAQGAGHAVLLQGPQGVGQFEFALGLAQAYLCESGSVEPGSAEPACGVCASCRLFSAHTHPDLLMVVPDALRELLGWQASESAGEETTASATRTKPSKEIRIDDIREVIAFAQSTSARGHGKMVVFHPAESMNPAASNALLKTLEEPVGRTRFILSCAAPDALLPTVRSRCRAIDLSLPSTAAALAWLETQGVQEPEVLLRACSGRPLEVLDWVRLGIDAPAWKAIPGLITKGREAGLAEWPLPLVVQTLLKLCHDMLCIAASSTPRYFPLDSIASGSNFAALTDWAAQLRRDARQCEHPWNAGLKIESLVMQAQIALCSAEASDGNGRKPRAFVHSRP